MRALYATALAFAVLSLAIPFASASASPLTCASTFAAATQANAQYPVAQGGRHADALKNGESAAAERFLLVTENGFGSWFGQTNGLVQGFAASFLANPGSAATFFANREVAITSAYATAVANAAVPLATTPVKPASDAVGNVGQALQWEQGAAFAFVNCA